jgi:hypothetical protein
LFFLIFLKNTYQCHDLFRPCNACVGLSLLIKGSASCNYSKDLQAEQEFFSVDRKLIDTKAESTDLATGNYTYDFEYRLPRNIPYSVDGQHGNVKYFVQGNLLKTTQFDGLPTQKINKSS